MFPDTNRQLAYWLPGKLGADVRLSVPDRSSSVHHDPQRTCVYFLDFLGSLHPPLRGIMQAVTRRYKGTGHFGLQGTCNPKALGGWLLQLLRNRCLGIIRPRQRYISNSLQALPKAPPLHLQP